MRRKQKSFHLPSTILDAFDASSPVRLFFILALLLGRVINALAGVVFSSSSIYIYGNFVWNVSFFKSLPDTVLFLPKINCFKINEAVFYWQFEEDLRVFVYSKFMNAENIIFICFCFVESRFSLKVGVLLKALLYWKLSTSFMEWKQGFYWIIIWLEIFVRYF